jgi:hypothetical protein
LHHARSMSNAAIAGRRCLICNAIEPIASNEPVWPLGWQCHTCDQVIAQTQGISMFAPELADTISGFDPKAFDELAELEAPVISLPGWPMIQ